jgi:hypothetical protein
MSDGDVHVEPVNDLIEHDTSGGDCPCGPTTVPVERGDGSIGYVITHHALDGREHSEPDHNEAACPACSG